MNYVRVGICFFVAICTLLMVQGQALAEDDVFASAFARADRDTDFVSDDFNACVLDETIWQFIDPGAGAADASILRATGYTLEIQIPSRVARGFVAKEDESLLRVPRIMQTVNDADFEIDARFNSGLIEPEQSQGILVEGDSDNFLIAALKQEEGGPTIQASLAVSGTILTPPVVETPISTGEAPVYLRLSRVGDLWDMRYSYDGADWQAGGVFTHTLQVTSIGIFGGSQASGDAGTLPQTMVLDYAFRADDPVIPQDGLVMYADDLRIEIDPFADAGTVSGGPVTLTPGNPGCGNPIRLVALPKDGWRFDQWVWQGIESTDRVLEGAFGFGEDIVAQFIRLQERRIYLPSIWADVN